MPDIVDRAQERESELREEALARARRAGEGGGASSRACEDCGARIPAARRRAIDGCTRCVHCQADHEHRARRQQERT